MAISPRLENVTDAVRVEEAIRTAKMHAEREHLALEVLQKAALSVDLPPLAGVGFGLHYQPPAGNAPVGGDWYDVVARSDGHLTLIIADVAGHGLEAASFMVQLRNVLRTVATEEPDPGTVLERCQQRGRVPAACRRALHHLLRGNT